MIKRLNSAIQGFPACTFVALTFALSWGIWSLFRLYPSITPLSTVWTIIYVAGLCGPVAAAIGTTLLTQGRDGIRPLVAQLFFADASPAWYAFAVALPPAIWMVADKVGVGDAGTFLSPAVALILWIKILLRGGPLTEEIGWRGFLLPTLLSRMNLFRASVIIFPIWGLWHLPLWVLPGLPHKNWSYLLFLLLLAPLTLIFSWLYVKGRRTVWLPILFHTYINFSLHSGSVAPTANQATSGVLVLFACFSAIAAGLVVANRHLWFSVIRPPRPVSVQKPREELVPAELGRNISRPE